jgi:homoserine kinase
MKQEATVRIPATTANLGPGFDCLALCLDLWNETHFYLGTESSEGSGGARQKGIRVEAHGEGKGQTAEDKTNLIAHSALEFFRWAGAPEPQDLKIVCQNRIPFGSGLGSSASAVLAGLLGADALLGNPASLDQILHLAVKIEGHPDNAAAALLGGLVVVILGEDGPLARRFDIPPLSIAVVQPVFNLPTRAARAALPRSVPMVDAVFNLGRAALVVEALRAGDLRLLRQVMQDRLHQPFRFPLIPGSEEALDAACQAGAAAGALSGAGPSLVVFGGNTEGAARVMAEVFHQKGIVSRTLILHSTNQGAEVTSAVQE